MTPAKLRIRMVHTVLFILLIVFLLVSVTPVLWFAVVSLQPTGGSGSLKSIRAFDLTLQNYVTVFRQLAFSRFLLNSLIVCVSGVLIALVPGTLAAYALSRHKTALTKQIGFSILSTRMLPPIAVVIPLYLLLGRLALLDTYLGLILVYVTGNLPYIVWMLRSFMEDIPIAMDESAMVDGCSKVGLLYRIVLPIAMPGVISTAVFVFILNWSEFLYALIMTGIHTKTLPVGIAAFITDRGIEWENMAAAGTAMILPLAVMFYVIQRYLIRGLTFGVVKG